MLREIRPAIVLIVALTLITGLAYPLAETVIGQAFFSHQANGSLTANGSTIIGQTTCRPILCCCL